MKTKKLLTILIIVSVVFVAGCKKDTFVEIVKVCPIVESTNPTNGSSGVPLNQVITVTFNEKMNPATVILESCNMEASFTLQGTVPVSGTISYNDKTAFFMPFGNLLPGTIYTATITTRIKNLDGISLAKKYVWSFTTAGENAILR
ncbi:MAG: Ig-like domain-containing protein [Bacteroidales bacterium]|nr:Ig-like domain-containing protein [Bacteroidales bacterium]